MLETQEKITDGDDVEKKPFLSQQDKDEFWAIFKDETRTEAADGTTIIVKQSNHNNGGCGCGSIIGVVCLILLISWLCSMCGIGA